MFHCLFCSCILRTSPDTHAQQNAPLAEHDQIGNSEKVDENERRAQNAHGVQNGHNLVAETRGAGKLVPVSPSQGPQKALLVQNGHAVHKEHDAHQQLPRPRRSERAGRWAFFSSFLLSFFPSFCFLVFLLCHLSRTWKSPNMTTGCAGLGATPLKYSWTLPGFQSSVFSHPSPSARPHCRPGPISILGSPFGPFRPPRSWLSSREFAL